LEAVPGEIYASHVHTRLLINPFHEEFSSLMPPVFQASAQDGKRFLPAAILHEGLHQCISKAYDPYKFMACQPNEPYTNVEPRLSRRFENATHEIKAQIHEGIVNAEERLNLRIHQVMSKAMERFPQQNQASMLQRITQQLSPYWVDNSEEFLTTLMEAAIHFKLGKTKPTPEIMNALGHHTPEATTSLIQQATQPYTPEEYELLAVMVDESSKAFPPFKQYLQRIEQHWGKIAPTLLHWFTQP
jgi:hypothetical protein